MDDDAEGQRRHGEMMPLEPEHQSADPARDDRHDQRCKEDVEPGVESEAAAEHRGAVSAEAIESRMTERDLPGITHQQREADGRKRMQSDHDQQIGEIAAVEEKRAGERERQDEKTHHFTRSHVPSRRAARQGGRTGTRSSSTKAIAFL